MQPALQPLNRISSYTLAWVKPSWRKYEYALHDGDAIVATLAYNSWKGMATCATSAGDITIRREGFWQPRYIISSSDVTMPQATYRGHWTGKRGTLTFADGTTWQMHTQGAWRRATIWTDPTGRELVRSTTNARGQTTVTLDPAASSMSATLSVILLAQYLAVTAAVAAAASA